MCLTIHVMDVKNISKGPKASRGGERERDRPGWRWRNKRIICWLARNEMQISCVQHAFRSKKDIGQSCMYTVLQYGRAIIFSSPFLTGGD